MNEPNDGALRQAWFVKCVNSEMLQIELNAVAQQGYVIRWLFQNEWHDALWITVVAERVKEGSHD